MSHPGIERSIRGEEFKAERVEDKFEVASKKKDRELCPRGGESRKAGTVAGE